MTMMLVLVQHHHHPCFIEETYNLGGSSGTTKKTSELGDVGDEVISQKY